MAPGLVICQICHDDAETQLLCPIDCEHPSAPPPQDISFWPNNVEDCCSNLATYESDFLSPYISSSSSVDVCDGDFVPQMALRAYMWDQFLTCTDIESVYPMP